MQQLQLWNIVIHKSEEKVVPLLPNIVLFHCLLNGSVQNSKILNFEFFL